MASFPSKDVERAVSARRIEGQWPLENLLGIISDLTRFNKRVKTKKKFGKILMIGGGILLLFLGIMPLGEHPEKIILWIITGGLAAIFILGLYLFFSSKRLELVNDLETYLLPLLKTLQKDIGDENVAISFDLHLPFSEKFKKGPSKEYTKNSYYYLEHYYERDFFSLTIPFVDGNRLRISCHESSLDLERQKKKKVKHKYRRKFSINAALEFRVKNYKTLSPEKLTEKNVSFKDKGKKGVVTIKFTEKIKSTSADLSLTPKKTLENILRLYGSLMPVRAGMSKAHSSRS